MPNKSKEQRYQDRKKHNARLFTMTILSHHVPLIKAFYKTCINTDNSINKQVKQYLKQQLKELK